MQRNVRRSSRVCLATVVALVAALAFVVAEDVLAQQGAIRGRIVDDSGQPLEGVKVEIRQIIRPPRMPQRVQTETDAEGGFSAVGLPTGRYRLTYSKEGYEKVVMETNVPDGMGDVGVVELAKLPEGVLSEEQHAEAQKHLERFEEASKAGDHEAAIEAMKGFLEMVPDSAEGHFNLGAVYEKSNRLDEAIASYEKALELRPNFEEALVAVGDLYGRKKEWAKAQAALEKALEDKQETYLLFNLGAYATNAGDHETALKAFRQVIEEQPDNAMAHYQIGMLLLPRQKNEEAAVHFEKYLELDPQGAHAESVRSILEQLNKQP